MSHNKFIEVMSIPVLSTAHLPSEDAVATSGLLNAPYREGWFLWLGDAEDKADDEPPWVAPIRDWAKRIVLAAQWVRFDMDADVICELEKYEW